MLFLQLRITNRIIILGELHSLACSNKGREQCSGLCSNPVINSRSKVAILVAAVVVIALIAAPSDCGGRSGSSNSGSNSSDSGIGNSIGRG